MLGRLPGRTATCTNLSVQQCIGLRWECLPQAHLQAASVAKDAMDDLEQLYGLPKAEELAKGLREEPPAEYGAALPAAFASPPSQKI